MANNQLPMYNPSVRLEVTPQADTDSAAQQMINSFKEFSNVTTAAVVHFTNAEAEDRKQIIRNNISTAYTQFAQDALAEPNKIKALNNYDKSAISYAKQVQQQAGSHNAAYTTSLLNYYANEHRSPILRESIQQSNRILETEAILRNNQATIDEDAAVHNANPAFGNDKFESANSLHAQNIAALKNQFSLGIIKDPRTLARAIAISDKHFREEKIVKGYIDAKDKTAYKKELIDFSNQIDSKGLNYHDVQSLLSRFKAVDIQKTIDAGMSKEMIHDLMKRELKDIEDNGSLENADLNTLVEEVLPQSKENFQTQKKIAARIYNITKATANMNPNEATNYINNLDQDEEKYGIPKIMHKEIVQKAIGKVKQNRKMFAADPMVQTNKQSFITDSANDNQLVIDAGANIDHQNNSPINADMNNIWKAVIKYQQSLGLSLTGKKNNSIRLLTNADANQRVIDLEQSSPQQKIQYMNNMAKEFNTPLAYNLAIKQLVNAGMPEQYSYLANLDPNSPDAIEMANAFAVPLATLHKELKAKNSASVTNIDATVKSDIYSGTYGSRDFNSFLKTTGRNDDIEYLKGLESTIQQLAYYGMITGKDNNYTKAVTRAENIIAGRYNYMAIDNHSIRLPKDKNYVPSTILEYAKKHEKLVNDYPFVLPAKYADEIRQNIYLGHWQNDSVDHGLVWVDRSGVLWRDKNGQPFSISFDDAQNGPYLHEATDLEVQRYIKENNTLERKK